LCETSGGSNGQKTAQDKKAIHSHAPSAIPSPAVMEKDNRQAQQNSQQIQSIIPDRQHIRKPTDKQSVVKRYFQGRKTCDDSPLPIGSRLHGKGKPSELRARTGCGASLSGISI
jgi:hypothetical protein